MGLNTVLVFKRIIGMLLIDIFSVLFLWTSIWNSFWALIRMNLVGTACKIAIHTISTIVLIACLAIFPFWFSSTRNGTLLVERYVLCNYRRHKIIWFHKSLCRPTNGTVKCFTGISIMLKRIVPTPGLPDPSIDKVLYH